MAASRLTPVQWLICAIAAIGFAFDIYELLMLPLIIKPAIASLSAPLVEQLVAGGMPRPQAMALWVPGGAEYVSWARTLFFVPAMVGGVFGLLGGYLTDLLGRRRVLTFSILLYALRRFAAGFVTSLEQLLVLRCAVFVGVCVEFVAAVAWLAELFADPHQREKVLGYTQAFSSLGGILVAGRQRPGGQHRHQPAGDPRRPRGVALHADLRRDPGAAADRSSGRSCRNRRRGRPSARPAQLRRPSIAELFGPGLARATIVTTLVFAASYGIAFGAIQQLPQILGAPNRGHVEIVAEAAGGPRAGDRHGRGAGPTGAARARAAAGRGQRHRPGRGDGRRRGRRSAASPAASCSRCSPPGRSSAGGRCCGSSRSRR